MSNVVKFLNINNIFYSQLLINARFFYKLFPYLVPVPEHIRAYIASLDYDADVALLRRTVGTTCPHCPIESSSTSLSWSYNLISINIIFSYYFLNFWIFQISNFWWCYCFIILSPWFSLLICPFLFSLLLGAAIPETSLLTLRVCTLVLQIGVAEGLSLHDIGTAMSPSLSPSLHTSSSPCAQGLDLCSPLHQAVRSAVQVLQQTTEYTNMQYCPSSICCNITMMSILQNQLKFDIFEKLAWDANISNTILAVPIFLSFSLPFFLSFLLSSLPSLSHNMSWKNEDNNNISL